MQILISAHSSVANLLTHAKQRARAAYELPKSIDRGDARTFIDSVAADGGP